MSLYLISATVWLVRSMTMAPSMMFPLHPNRLPWAQLGSCYHQNLHLKSHFLTATFRLVCLSLSPHCKSSPSSTRSPSQWFLYFLYVHEPPPIITSFCIHFRGHSSSLRVLKILLNPLCPLHRPYLATAQRLIHDCT